MVSFGITNTFWADKQQENKNRPRSSDLTWGRIRGADGRKNGGEDGGENGERRWRSRWTEKIRVHSGIYFKEITIFSATDMLSFFMVNFG